MTADWSMLPGLAIAAVGTVGAWLLMKHENRTGKAVGWAWSRERTPTAFRIRQLTNRVIFVLLALITLWLLLQVLGIVRAFHH